MFGRSSCVVARRSVALLVVGAAMVVAGCSHHSKKADGAKIFHQVCARCHGPEGVPSPDVVARIGVKPLVSRHVQVEMTDADIRHQIIHGSKNHHMPALGGALSNAQITAVIRYVRTLGPKKWHRQARAAPTSPSR